MTPSGWPSDANSRTTSPVPASTAREVPRRRTGYLQPRARFDPALVAAARLGVIETGDDLARRPHFRVRARGGHGSATRPSSVSAVGAGIGASSTTPKVHQSHRVLT